MANRYLYRFISAKPLVPPRDLLANARENKRKKLRTRMAVRSFATVVAMVLGFSGFMRIPSDTPGNLRVVESLYRSAQLITVQMPKELPVNLPIELQIARFAVPLSMLWLSLGAHFDFVARPLRRFLVFRRRNHVMVIGTGRQAQMMAMQLAAENNEVVVVIDHDNDTIAQPLEELGIIVVVGDPEDKETHFRGGLTQAKGVIVATTDNVRNLRVASLLRSTLQGSHRQGLPTLRLIVEVTRHELAETIETFLSADQEQLLECRILHPQHNTARNLLPHMARLLSLPSPAILLFGFDEVAEVILLTLLRHASPDVRVAIVVEDADRLSKRLLDEYPALSLFPGLVFLECQGTPLKQDTQELGRWMIAQRPEAILINGEDDESNLLATLSFWHLFARLELETAKIFVRQDGPTSAMDTMALLQESRFDVSRIQIFGGNFEPSATDVILNSILDQHAEAIHEHYRQLQRENGAPVMAAWAQLDETSRRANRIQADDIDVKLACLGLRRWNGESGNIRLSDEQIESVAKREHWRWCINLWLDGWVQGPVKNMAARTHPQLIPFEALPETSKEYNRDVVRQLPNLVKTTGWGLRHITRIHADQELGMAAVLAAVDAALAKGLAPVLEVTCRTEADLEQVEACCQRGAALELLWTKAMSELLNSPHRPRLLALLKQADRILEAE